MEGARFKILPVFGSLLLLSWSLTCVHGEALNTHELIFNIFELDEKDVRYLDKLVEIHTKNGVFDKEGYDNAMKQRNPLLHAKMENFRKIYREVEKENSEAVGFIDTIFRTARSVRGSVITTAKEMRLIQSRFDLLSNSAQQYLMKKFPPLKFLGQKFTGTTSRVIETSTSTPGTTTSGNHGKQLDNMRAIVMLESAKENLESITFLDKFRNVRKKINDLLKMEPKDWKEENLEEVLQSFKKALKGRVKAGTPYVTDDDFYEASQFLVNLCRAFSHRGCSIPDIIEEVKRASRMRHTDSKFDELLKIIQAQIDDIEARR